MTSRRTFLKRAGLTVAGAAGVVLGLKAVGGAGVEDEVAEWWDSGVQPQVAQGQLAIPDASVTNPQPPLGWDGEAGTGTGENIYTYPDGRVWYAGTEYPTLQAALDVI